MTWSKMIAKKMVFRDVLDNYFNIVPCSQSIFIFNVVVTKWPVIGSNFGILRKTPDSTSETALVRVFHEALF